MANVVFETIQKPLQQRLIDAACIYWSVDESYFKSRERKGNSTEHRYMLFYLLKHEAGLGVRNIAELFGLSHPSVVEGLEVIEFRKSISLPIARDIERISNIAAKLQARMVAVDIKLYGEDGLIIA